MHRTFLTPTDGINRQNSMDEILTSSGCTPTNAGRSSTSEALWVHNIATEVVRRSRSIAEPHVNVVQADIGAWCHGTALETGDSLVLCSSSGVPDFQVPDLKLRVGAVARPGCSGEAGALGDGESAASHALHFDVFGCDV